MIQKFVDSFMTKKPELETHFKAHHPENYKAIVLEVIKAIQQEEAYGDDGPDPERIHEINDGDYQGTMLYVIGAKGYQPSTYWYVKVSYGSCSGCDTLEGIKSYDDDPPKPEQTEGYMTLALHVVQGLKEMKEDAV